MIIIIVRSSAVTLKQYDFRISMVFMSFQKEKGWASQSQLIKTGACYKDIWANFKTQILLESHDRMVLGPFHGCVQTGISPCSVMNIFVMTNRIANEKIEMCCYANLSNYEARQRTRDTRPLDNSCTCCLCVKLGFVYHPLLMYCELRKGLLY